MSADRRPAPTWHADAKALLTESEFAEVRNLSLGWLRDDRRGPRLIPYVQLGRVIRYRLDLADAAIEKLFKGRIK